MRIGFYTEKKQSTRLVSAIGKRPEIVEQLEIVTDGQHGPNECATAMTALNRILGPEMTNEVVGLYSNLLKPHRGTRLT